MRTEWRVGFLALGLLAAAALFAACNDGGNDDSAAGGDGSGGLIEGRLPAGFPEDFPLYPDLQIRLSYPFTERFIVEADSDDSVEKIVEFYSEKLAEGRWEVVEIDDSSRPDATILVFAVSEVTVDGRILVAKDSGDGEGTIVAIAVPLEAGQSD